MIALPTIQGVIRRRILANYRADPEVVTRLLPNGFTPKLHQGYGIVGICLIRLEDIRPLHTPSFVGISSENAAHRIAVNWTSADNSVQEGVFIPRRDTNSTLNHLAGGRIFPGEHHFADFDVHDDGTNIDFHMSSRDGHTKVSINATSAEALPKDSIFDSVDSASAFFEGGSLGYSATKDKTSLDGIELDTNEWHVEPLAVSEVHSSFFGDPEVFPADSIYFDHALVMRGIKHQWHGRESMPIEKKL
jgi:uncharacterized protein YqjF (DUF2071 family)